MKNAEVRTVKELIEKLKDLPQDALILVDGYEGGYSVVISIEQEHVIPNDGDCCGLFGDYEADDRKKKAGDIAIILHR